MTHVSIDEMRIIVVSQNSQVINITISKAKLTTHTMTLPITILRTSLSLLTEDLVHKAAPKRQAVATQVAIMAVMTDVAVSSAAN